MPQSSVLSLFFPISKRKKRNTCPADSMSSFGDSSEDLEPPDGREKLMMMQTVIKSEPVPIPEGPVEFQSLGNADAFIELLQKRHIVTKKDLFDLSLRPSSFDPRDELKANLNNLMLHHSIDHEHCHSMKSKKVHRMHFIGSYNFLNSDDFEEELPAETKHESL